MGFGVNVFEILRVLRVLVVQCLRVGGLVVRVGGFGP